jgi:hypothetical protein
LWEAWVILSCEIEGRQARRGVHLEGREDIKEARIGVERSGWKRVKWTLIRRRGSVVHHAPLPLGGGLERQRASVGQARDLYLLRGGVRHIIKMRKGTLGDRRGIRMW